ncbi:hypothetical protein ACOYW6_06580 [Parablastomonas sp. CN1-191]|uniref:hypothetical protein n=1 Tax=Parablastomonas sp. CN1-191 TaxID=3400908 RepID=UPI003BF8A85D
MGAALSLLASGAAAQSVNDYRLPGAPTANPRVQGPVTPDNPVILSPRPSQSPSATAAPAPAPAPATRAPSPAPSAAARPAGVPGNAQPGPFLVPRPAPSASAQAARPAATGTAPSSTATQDPGAALGLPPFTPASSPAPTYAPIAAAPPAAPAATSSWPLIAGTAAALLAILGGALFWRRRRAEEADPVVNFVPPVVAAPPVPPLEPAPAPAMAAPVPPPPPAGPAPRGIGLVVEATRMSASLIATTLSYKLTLTNHTDTPLSAVAIEGDMIAAQAQVPQERQVALPTQRLEGRFELPELGPGESAEFKGDIRVPLNTIVPIRAGAQALFIPLARFRVEAGRNGSGRMAVSRTWVVGEEPEAPGAPLKPFRLDLGPRTYSRLGQRAVN